MRILLLGFTLAVHSDPLHDKTTPSKETPSSSNLNIQKLSELLSQGVQVNGQNATVAKVLDEKKPQLTTTTIINDPVLGKITRAEKITDLRVSVFPDGANLGVLNQAAQQLNANPEWKKDFEKLQTQNALEAQRERAAKKEAKVEEASQLPKNSLLLDKNTAELATRVALYVFQKDPSIFKENPQAMRLGEELTGKLNDKADSTNKQINTLPSTGGSLAPEIRSAATGQYLDLARNLILPVIDPQVPTSFQQNPNEKTQIPAFDSKSTENLKNFYSSNLTDKEMAKSLEALSNVVKSPVFQEKADSIIGPVAKNLAQDAYLAATALNNTQNSIGPGALKLLNSLVSMNNNGYKTALGGAENKSDYKVSPQLAVVLGKAGDEIDEKTLEWVERARILAKVQRNNPSDSKLWILGAIELEKLIAVLKTFRALNLLALVSEPQDPPFWKLFNDAIHEISKLLSRELEYRQLASKDSRDYKNISQRLLISSKKLLQKLSLSKDSQSIEETMDSFFFDSKERQLWKTHDPKRYEKLRELTGLIKISRRLSFMDSPPSERPTPERVALAYVVIQAQKDLKSQELNSDKKKKEEAVPARKDPIDELLI